MYEYLKGSKIIGLFYDQLVPQSKDIDGGTIQTRKVEKLRLSICAKIMMHRYFRNAKPRGLKFLNHLHTNDPAARFQLNLFKDRSSDQTEVAIHVAQFHTKPDSDDPMVNSSNDLAVQRIASGNFVTIYPAHVVGQLFQQRREL